MEQKIDNIPVPTRAAVEVFIAIDIEGNIARYFFIGDRQSSADELMHIHTLPL
jgi:hypothetical protein